MNRAPVPVLIVDDLPAFREAASATVRATPGFTVAGEASTGAEALSVLGRTAVELVLMDVHMPGRSGLDIAAEMLADRPALQVVLLSVDNTARLRAAARTCGVRLVPKAAFGPDALEVLWSERGRPV
jgi:two-component system, NarL family, invasion response regulator UvrY